MIAIRTPTHIPAIPSKIAIGPGTPFSMLLSFVKKSTCEGFCIFVHPDLLPFGLNTYLAPKRAKNEPNKISIRLKSSKQITLGTGSDVIAPIVRSGFVIQPSSDKIKG